MLCLSSDGYLYLGHLTKQSIDLAAVHESTEEFVEQKSNRRLDICEQTRCEITTERIPNIDRVTDVSVDQCGESFVILQVRAYARGGGIFIFQLQLIYVWHFSICRKIQKDI